MNVKQVRFTDEDRECLENSVVKIVNGHHTGREIGSPITDLGLRMWNAFEKTGEVSPKSYFTNAADGSLLKSTTCVLAGPQQKPIGMLCINMNLSFPFPEIVKTLMPQCNVPQTIVSETFSNNANDVIQQALSSAIKEVDQDESVSSKSRNKAIIRCLFDNGVFELKETTTQVSEQLGISRQAVYKFIREFKSE